MVRSFLRSFFRSFGGHLYYMQPRTIAFTRGGVDVRASANNLLRNAVAYLDECDRRYFQQND